MDITRNIFYWFRGPSKAPNGSDHHAQLENNLTKGFVCVLEHCDLRLVLNAFLRRLGLRPRTNVAFSLQRRPMIADTVSHRLIVGITGGIAQVCAGESEVDAGRPDAWVFSDKWAVLIESKLGRKLDECELRGHARTAGWKPGSYRIVLLRWQDVHRLCKAAERATPKRDAVSQLLLHDWLRYMENQGMAEFDGLEEVDFDFLGLPADERRAMLGHVRRRIRSFANLLANRPEARRIAELYRKHKVADWKYSDPNASGQTYWFNIGGDPSPQEWHATVFFRQDGLSLELLNSQNHLVRTFCRQGVDGFRRIVDMASRHDDVYVGCRRAWYRDPDKPYPGQHIGRTDQPIMVAPASFADGASRESYAVILRNALMHMSGSKRFRTKLGNKLFRTELNIRLTIPRDELVHLPLSRQVSKVGKALGQLEPILAFLLKGS